MPTDHTALLRTSMVSSCILGDLNLSPSKQAPCGHDTHQADNEVISNMGYESLFNRVLNDEHRVFIFNQLVPIPSNDDFLKITRFVVTQYSHAQNILVSISLMALT